MSSSESVLFYDSKLDFPMIDTALAIPNVPTNNNTLTSLPIANHPPVANAGINQTVNENTTVVLNGIASDPDVGDFSTLNYLWKQIAGPAVIFSNDNTTNPSFTAPTVSSDRELRFLLTAKDEKGVASNNSAIVTITVKHVNHNPVANAGQDQIVNPGDIVALDGSKSIDPDNDSIKYLWTQARGPSVELNGNNTVTPTFTAPSNTSADTDLIFRLTVEDVKNSTGSDDVKIMIGYIPPSNQPPIANASIDQIVDAGNTVQLDGSKSIDPGGIIRSYLWNQIAGQHVVLNDTKTSKPSFIAPSNISAPNNVLLFQLTVTDDNNATGLSTVKVTVNPVSRAPIANAGVNQTVNAGDIAPLDGSKSIDPDGDPLTYSWIQANGPSATLNNADKPIATITTPSDITSDIDLIFELTVTDDRNATSTSHC